MNYQIILKRQKNLVCKIFNIAMLTLLTVTVKPAIADNNPDILPPNTIYRGFSYSQWSAEWFKWAYSLPLTHHPFNNNAPCSAGQTGNVWFIGGPLTNGFPTQGRDCTIPPGTALFLTVAAQSWDNENCSGGSLDIIQKTTYSDDQLRVLAQRDLLSRYNGPIKIIIDEVEVKGLPIACDPTNLESCDSVYRVQSPVFDYTVPGSSDNILKLFDGACYDDSNRGHPYKVTGAVGDGYYVMIKPLAIGNHTIRFGKPNSQGNPVILYNITVSDKDMKK